MQEPGYYDLSYRYASDIPNGGGPFFLELNGTQISDNLSVGNTGDWYNWLSESVSDIELNAGEHTLRLVFIDGGFNLGRMTFTFNRELDYNPPYADAGEDVIVLSPATSATLNGSLSYDNDSDVLNYLWVQIYGPVSVSFSNANNVQTEISDLIQGVYKFELTVDDGNYSSIDYILVFVSETSDFYPVVTLNTSLLNTSYYFGNPLEINASASDLDGYIEVVEFYGDDVLLGTDTTEPYSFLWENISVGSHTIYVNAIDNDGLISTSNSHAFEVLEAPQCTGGPDNGHYTYQFSDDLNNPTLTFIPSASHVGDPICILYYSTSGTPPGYNVTPNVPFTINADEGEVINFYYTYSYNGMEENTSADPHSYEIGSCNESDLSISENVLPLTFALYDNYPNPFNPITSFRYDLPEDGLVNITVYDMLGNVVNNLVSTYQSSGFKSIQWNATNNQGQSVSAGVYLYSIEAEDFRQTKKMILLK